MTSSTTLQDDLQARLADLRGRHEVALEDAHNARDERSRVAGLHVLGETDQEALSVASGAMQGAEQRAADLASAIAVIENRIAGAEANAREVATAALQGKGHRLSAARQTALLDAKESFATAALAIARYDKANGAIAELRDQAVAIFDPEAHHAEVAAEIRGLVDAAPAGQFVNPAILDRREQEGREKVETEARAAADAVGSIADDDALREAAAAAGIPITRLIPASLARDLGAGREFVDAGRPPSMAGMPGSHSVRRLYGDGELPIANQRWSDFVGALDRLAINRPSIADSYRGSAGGTTVAGSDALPIPSQEVAP